MNSPLKEQKTMNQKLETYLAETNAALSHLPETKRRDELTELRLHLEAAIEAHMLCGKAEGEATNLTLTQFGASQTVARGLEWQWIRAWIAGNGVKGTALMTVVIITLFDGVFTPLRELLTTYYFWATGSLDTSPYGRLPFILPLVSVYSLVAGVIVGRVAPRTAVRGVVVGQVSLMLYETFISAAHSEIVSRMNPDINSSLGNRWAIMLFLCSSLLLCTVAGAAIGARWHQKRWFVLSRR